MSWLYGQTWLWYLLAFLIGVLLAWIALVLPASRRLRAHRGEGPLDRGPAAATPSTTAPDPARRPAGDDAPTERFPAVNPAMSTLDTFGSATPPRGAATAGLGAAGLGSGAHDPGDRDPDARDPDATEPRTAEPRDTPPETSATSGNAEAEPDRRA